MATKKTTTKSPKKAQPRKASAKATKSTPKRATGAKAKKSSAEQAAKRPPADGEGAPETKPAKKTGSAAIAAAIIADENAPQKVAEQAELLLDSRSTTATKAARVIGEIASEKPELLVTHVEKFARSITSSNKRVIQAGADALPAIAKLAPARVAKHLDTLKAAFDETTLDGKDGLVRTFANLCTASVAYQKRLEPVLAKALEIADGKTLLRWSQVVLPALKGEPHARARAVVEDRLDRIPRSTAQQIATTLNFKLRVRYR
ncbi:MAG: hypothetical protein AAF447_05020 [Myxococcota bacterium]